jgi:hypothetical protein
MHPGLMSFFFARLFGFSAQDMAGSFLPGAGHAEENDFDG